MKKSGPWRRFRQIGLKPLDSRARTIEKATLRHANRFLVGRLANVQYVRRHVSGLLFLLALLIGLTGLQTFFNFQTVSHSAKVTGGTYAEGMVGPLNTLNPLYASSSAELAVSHLLFSGLLKYDSQGKLEGDLAENWQVKDKGKQYVMHLKPALRWHDGKPLTAKDVVFTIHLMQNAKVAALQNTSWQGIDVSAPDDTTVIFQLPSAYAPFASALTFAVLPQHLLEKIAPEKLQESDFNKHPIGSGPFRYVSKHTLDAASDKTALQLDAFAGYNDGQPASSHFTVYVYDGLDSLARGLRSHEINAAVGLPNRISTRLGSDFTKLTPSLNNGVYALLKNDNPILKDATVRQALERATDTSQLRKGFSLKPLAGPIISAQLPKASAVHQADFNQTKAAALFAKAGWKKNSDGILQKKKKLLELKVVAIDAGHYPKILDRLQDEWRQVGVKVDKQLVDPQQVQQTVLQPRDFDVLLYELELGGDPDGYAYWHSSQTSDAGLNFTGYSSALADDALITGRSRTDKTARDIRYASFARQWVKDAPAIALYRSTLSYVETSKLHSINSSQDFVSPADRYSDVVNWTNTSGRIYNTP